MIEITAIDKNGNREEIKDLYWFEENRVHDFEGDCGFKFEVRMGGKTEGEWEEWMCSEYGEKR